MANLHENFGQQANDPTELDVKDVFRRLMDIVKSRISDVDMSRGFPELRVADNEGHDIYLKMPGENASDSSYGISGLANAIGYVFPDLNDQGNIRFESSGITAYKARTDEDATDKVAFGPNDIEILLERLTTWPRK